MKCIEIRSCSWTAAHWIRTETVGVHWLSAPTVDCCFLRWSSLTHWLYYWSCLVHWLNQCQCPCYTGSRWRIFAVFADLGRPHALLILLHWKMNNPPTRQRQRSRFSWAGLKNKSSGDWRGRKPYYSVVCPDGMQWSICGSMLRPTSCTKRTNGCSRCCW